jgi:hypothetical protein
MVGSFSVEARSRWDATALLRLLDAHHAWTVQLGQDLWVVAGRAETEADGRLVTRIVSQWARERGRPQLARTLVNEVALTRLAEPSQ